MMTSSRTGQFLEQPPRLVERVEGEPRREAEATQIKAVSVEKLLDGRRARLELILLLLLVLAGPAASVPHGHGRQEDPAAAVVLRSREGHGHLARPEALGH